MTPISSSNNPNLGDSVVNKMSILDLPELALESILERLPLRELCVMASVCTSLRERCVTDHFWKKHMNHKWGKIIGLAAYREWKWQLNRSNEEFGCCKMVKDNENGFFTWLLSLIWPLKTKVDSCKQRRSLPVDSVMSYFIALETGKFLFPAQVFNRENGNVGFVLSCYDADLRYNSYTDTFEARYPLHGRRAMSKKETCVSWERIRAPSIDTSWYDLCISDCLNDLFPGDHFEIQWRKNKEFPYGWWYGVVGHLDSCDGNQNYCRCHQSNTVVLEFHQYAAGSRWRRKIIKRKDHREEGDGVAGFYSGVRKLYNHEEISRWKQFWPKDTLDGFE